VICSGHKENPVADAAELAGISAAGALSAPVGRPNIVPPVSITATP